MSIDPEALHDYYAKAAFPKLTKNRSKANRAKQLRDERKAIQRYMAEHPVCEACGECPSVHCDHIEPKQMGGSRESWIHSEVNFQALCLACHEVKHHIRPAIYAFGIEAA